MQGGGGVLALQIGSILPVSEHRMWPILGLHSAKNNLPGIKYLPSSLGQRECAMRGGERRRGGGGGGVLIQQIALLMN